jgi:hypothetical protein
MALVGRQLATHGVADMPIWFTEFGWSAPPPSPAPLGKRQVTYEAQANYVANFLEYVGTTYPQVAVAMVYEGFDNPLEHGNAGAMGMFTSALAPKPVVAPLKQLYA